MTWNPAPTTACSSRERVAVIVVHGVADQRPNDSVRQVANLLSNVNDNGEAAYSQLEETPIRVPVRPIPVTRDHAAARSFYDVCTQDNEAGTDIGDLFTDGRLAAYADEGPAGTYETIRIRARRRPSPTGGPGQTVDLFEMHWADLSRVGTSAWKILGELYQVLLHLPSLAKHAASAAVATDRSFPGKVLQRSTAFASWLLTVPIAVLNVYFIVAALLILVSHVRASLHAPIAMALIGVALVAVVIRVLIGLKTGRRVFQALIAVGGVVTTTALVASSKWAAPGSALLGIETLVVGVVMAGFILRAYGRHRPGIHGVSLAAGLFVVVVAISELPLFGGATGKPWYAWTAAPGFRIVEALYLVLTLAWVVFFVSVATATAAGSWYWRVTTSKRDVKSANNPIGRAVRTARIALAAPAALFLLLTVTLWSGVLYALDPPTTPATEQPASSGTGESIQLPFAQSYEVWTPFQTLLPKATSGRTLIDNVLAESLGIGFAGSAILMGVGVLLIAIPLIPVVFPEVRPPTQHRRSVAEGRWLTEIFAVVRASGFLIVAGVLLLPLGQYIWPWITPVLMSALGEQATHLESTAIVKSLGLAVAGGAIGLIALRGRIQKLACGFRGPADVLLDVDGYLREHPGKRSPRARIFARYFSLLKLIGESRYTRVVIIAHSQGTVITADLLRHLWSRHSQRKLAWPLGGADLTLFTMGSPLRQLYARRFPQMYEWVLSPDAPASNSETVPSVSDIDASRKPHPESLGVSCWVNAYRSGDYVGRWLWRSDTCRYLFQVPSGHTPWQSIMEPLPAQSKDDDRQPARRELCIGAGAHTHYSDGHAPEVAVELDYLVRGRPVDSSGAAGGGAKREHQHAGAPRGEARVGI
jgi:hypothetical protein